LARPLIGGLIGLVGGIPGFFIGFLLGYLVGELFTQTFRDKRIIEYFENPGSQKFNESESGIAAWCALGILVAEENQGDNSMAERILKQIFLEACYVFNSPFLDPYQIEHFSRLAWEKRFFLNPDLLSESFAFRRSLSGDAAKLARRFMSIAESEKAKKLAKEINLIIDPGFRDEEPQNAPMPKDPWMILGLEPGTPLKEIKAHYRRLAKQFHPDNLEVLDEKQKEIAARAFVAIKDAYLQITGEQGNSK